MGKHIGKILRINLDGSIYHNVCAKCSDCRCQVFLVLWAFYLLQFGQITLSNFTKSGDTLLCKTHYFKRFKEEGNYLGGEKFDQKSSRGNATTFAPPTVATAPPPSEPAVSSTEGMKNNLHTILLFELNLRGLGCVIRAT